MSDETSPADLLPDDMGEELLAEVVPAYPESRDILLAYLEDRASNSSENKRHALVPHVYHASEVGYCLRQLYYKHMGYEQENEKPLGIFIMGELVEELLTAAYSYFYGAERIKKLPVKIGLGEATITGSTDIIVFDEEGSPALQAEVKSNIRGKNARPGYHQLTQASVYRKALTIPENRVIHPSRNDPVNMPARDFRITDELGEELFAQAVARVKKLEEHLYVLKTVPPACPPTNSQCKYCPYIERCRTDGGWRNGFTPKLKKPKLFPPNSQFPQYDDEEKDND